MKVSEETKMQIDFVDWCKANYPDLLVIRVPNDAKRSKLDGYISKRMGTVAGVPDLFVPKLNLWIELKTSKGKLSKSQQQTQQRIITAGHSVCTCYSLIEAQKALESLINF